ncbi:winged helix-turn-helix transcriptional regulator [Sporolactobacillus sp. KGMB 08714]|uniref:winged helix-turn-helix transcriptional regulator n=1 Tax=Sporolactobacillus sp. KGMB 08714 TaxID=3064704 RepID=UPI002FBE091C
MDFLDRACPVEVTLSVIGGKWKGVILYHLQSKPLRFNELRRLIPDVTQRMLTLQLRELEEDGVIHREVYPVVPPKVEYSLTDFGSTLSPVILSIRQWGKRHQDEIRTIKSKQFSK